MNKSGLKALGRAILVKPYEKEIEKAVSETKIIIPENVRESTVSMENRVIIVEIGPEAWVDEKAPRAAVGDKVLVTRAAGNKVRGTADGEWYRLINDRDIYCQIEVEV